MAQCGRMVRLVPTPHRVRFGVVFMLPLLHGRTEIELVGPAIPALLAGEPIGVSNGSRLGQAIWWNFACLDPPGRLHALMNSFAIHAGVDQEVPDMNILRPQLARHRLGHSSKSELRR